LGRGAALLGIIPAPGQQAHCHNQPRPPSLRTARVIWRPSDGCIAWLAFYSFTHLHSSQIHARTR
jgi:hypothetical protein